MTQPDPIPFDPMALTDDEWIAASQACCGVDRHDDGDDDANSVHRAADCGESEPTRPT